MKRGAILAAVLLCLCAARPARSDDPVSSAVRFNREVIRIFDRKCLACHAPGAIAMSLATYREARPWARAIREELVEQRMPPWSAARGSARFTGDIGLTPRELTTILTWVDGGVPRGDDSDLPTPAHGDLAAADLTLDLPSQAIPGAGADIVRRALVTMPGAEDRWVRQLRIRPGVRRLVRAAFVSIDGPAGRLADTAPVWAGAWTPWQTSMAPPEPAAFLLRGGSRLVVELHYRGAEEPAVDRSAIELLLADGTPTERASTVVLRASRRRAPQRWTGTRTLSRTTKVWGLRAVGLTEGQAFEVTAATADGAMQVLLWIPRYRAEWPAPFVLAQPLTLSAGTRLRVTSTGAARPTSAVLAVAAPR